MDIKTIEIDPKRLETLQQRNEAILEGIRRKAQALCPDSLALIGIYGSFATGEVHAHSDLDLLLLIHDERGLVLADTFLLEDVGYDLYCTTWPQLEQDAAHPHPHIAKWMDANIVYWQNDEVKQRFEALRSRASARLAAPFSVDTVAEAAALLSPAYAALFQLRHAPSLSEGRYQAALVLHAAENAICTLNRRYFRLGTRRIFEELAEMPRRPEELLPQMRQLIDAKTLPQLQQGAERLLCSLSCYLSQAEAQVCPKQPPLPRALKGTYEEMISNWRGKLLLAARTGDASLAMHALASCRHMLESLSRRYALPQIDPLEGFDPSDVAGALAALEQALAQYRAFCEQAGVPLSRYASAAQWQAAYLSAGEKE